MIIAVTAATAVVAVFTAAIVDIIRSNDDRGRRPDQVIAGLRQQVAWGINHLIVSHGSQPSCLWSDDTLTLFAREVLPALSGT